MNMKSDMKITRKECIEILQLTGAALAKQLGFSDVKIGEDHQKGVWGEDFTRFLEEKYGECTKEIRWSNPDNPENYVRFDFQFLSPRLAIHTFDKGDSNENLASLKFSDFKADWSHYDELREIPHTEKKMGNFCDYIRDDNFQCTEKQIWGQKGSEYERMLKRKIAITMATVKFISRKEQGRSEPEKETEEMEL